VKDFLAFLGDEHNRGEEKVELREVVVVVVGVQKIDGFLLVT
jgi:hypothetical protein